MDEEESFRVTDRRAARETSPLTAASPPAAEAEQSAMAGPDPGLRDDLGPPPATATEAPDLQGVFAMFATSALISLGQAADADTGGMRVDLGRARDAIDVLALLREKTSGNRTQQESRFLDEILYDLQMRFVRASESTQPR